jgi:hypothetical protein
MYACIRSSHVRVHTIVRLCLAKSRLETLLRRITLLITSPILPHGLLCSALILLKVLDLIGIHVAHHLVGLPLLEAKPDPLMAIILVICPMNVSEENNSVLEVQSKPTGLCGT